MDLQLCSKYVGLKMQFVVIFELVYWIGMKVDVMLRGYSGYNTRWALKVIHRVFPAVESEEPPLAVTVFFGANDASLPDRSSSFQHVPLDEYKQNLRSIVFILKVSPSLCVYLCHAYVHM